MNIYDLYFNDVLMTERIDEYRRHYYDKFHLRAVAATRGQARSMGVRFLRELFGDHEITLEYLDPVSVRKIGTAWNGAQPECDWPIAFEYGCIEPQEWEIVS